MKPSSTQEMNANPVGQRATSLAGWPSVPPMRDGFWTPPTNVFETETGAMVQVEVAGLGSGSYRVQVENQRLRIEGSRPAGAQLAGCVNCRQVEIAGGRFRSDVELPWAAARESLQANYQDGFIFVQISPTAPSEG